MTANPRFKHKHTTYSSSPFFAKEAHVLILRSAVFRAPENIVLSIKNTARSRMHSDTGIREIRENRGMKQHLLKTPNCVLVLIIFQQPERSHCSKPESYPLVGDVFFCGRVCFDFFDSLSSTKVFFSHVDVRGKAKANSYTSLILCTFTSLCSSVTSWTDIKGSIRSATSLLDISPFFPQLYQCSRKMFFQKKKICFSTTPFCAAYRPIMQILHI